MNPEQIFSGFNLSIDQGIAEKLNVEAALIFNHILYWLKINARKPETSMIDGKYWMYETNKEMAEFFGFLSEEQISKGIKKLKEAGLIEVRKLSKNPFDHTSWYTVYDQEKIKKGLRNPDFGGIDMPILAESEPRILAESIYNDTTEKKQKKQQQQAAENVAAVDEKKQFREPDIEYENSRGEKKSISQSDIYRHFIKLPYKPEIVKQAIASMQTTAKVVNNPLKLLESICKTLIENKSHDIKCIQTEDKPKPKPLSECNHITWAEAERIYEENMKKKRNTDV